MQDSLGSHSLPVRQGVLWAPQDDGDEGGSLSASNGLLRTALKQAGSQADAQHAGLQDPCLQQGGRTGLLHTKGVPRTLVLDPEGSQGKDCMKKEPHTRGVFWTHRCRCSTLHGAHCRWTDGLWSPRCQVKSSKENGTAVLKGDCSHRSSSDGGKGSQKLPGSQGTRTESNSTM